MRTRSDDEKGHSRAIPIAMTVFGLFALFVGLLDPGGSDRLRPRGLTSGQMEQARADAAAGFRRPPLPDHPPRGPGE